MSVPPWISKMMQTSAEVSPAPFEAHKLGSSDHAPLIVSMLIPPPKPPASRPIPSWVTRSVEFKTRIKLATRVIDLEQLSPNQQLETFQLLIRDCAAQARNALLAK
eukprot:3205746-Karenia_brevis.AAC.1